MRASSILLSRRSYCLMVAASKEMPFSRGIWSMTSREMVKRSVIVATAVTLARFTELVAGSLD